jgi:DNA polymerase/3'-5' exonuclease PolX
LKHYDDLLLRIPYEEIQKHEKLLKNVLAKVDKSAELTITGSYRRKKSDSGDIDVLLTSTDKTTYDKFIKKLKKDAYLIEDLAFGRKKYNGISKIGRDGSGRRIDIMYTKPHEYPFAILYFTGSKEFNQMMRQEANTKGYTLNEYNLEELTEEKNVVDPNGEEIKTEKDIFDFLEMGYVEPWQREL